MGRGDHSLRQLIACVSGNDGFYAIFSSRKFSGHGRKFFSFQDISRLSKANQEFQDIIDPWLTEKPTRK
jgi:hypothetical protein